MANLFIPLDVDFPSDPKFLRAGPVAGYLYFVGCALIKRTKSDGFIATEQLPSLCVGFPGKPATHAARLVDAGLWLPVEGGWDAPGYVKRNPTRAQIESKQEAKRAAGIKANHDRWHSDGKRSDDCPHCIRLVSEVGAPSDPVASPETYTESKTETESSGGGLSAEVKAELEARLRRRRLRGEDIGPGLVRLILSDVERDLAITPLIEEDWIDPDCVACDSARWVYVEDLNGVVPCPSCRAAQSSGEDVA